MKKVKMKRIVLVMLMMAGIVGIYSCSKNDEQSTLQVRLTDNPTGLREVNVDIQKVRIKFSDDSLSNDGWVDMNTNARIYNLLGLQNGVDTLLATGTFPNNVVKEIRLILGPNNTVKDSFNVVHPLVIPSGGESGLKIKLNKNLNADLQTLLIDFDAALSIKKEADGYKLRPVLKIK
jgi:Domain of unknown function (DUF4382)